jgi:multimeric flavodoxin WrbA
LQIVTIVGNPRPESRTHVLARTVAAELARVAAKAAVSDVDLAVLGPAVLDQADPAAAEAVRLVLASDLLVLASPTYKATYSGLLKGFLDRFGGGSLAGKRAVPIMLGGAPNHQLAVDVHPAAAGAGRVGAGPRPVRARGGRTGLRRVRRGVGRAARPGADGRLSRAAASRPVRLSPVSPGRGGRLCRVQQAKARTP